MDLITLWICCLLAGEEGAKPPPPPLRPFIQLIALNVELMDVREVRYLLAREADYSSDWTVIRNRHHALLGMPYVQDSHRFPTREVVHEFLATNRQFAEFLHNRSVVDLRNFELYSVLKADTSALYEIWDLVRDVKCEFYYVTVRRQSLSRLRDLIGDEAYYSGNLPSPLPLLKP